MLLISVSCHKNDVNTTHQNGIDLQGINAEFRSNVSYNVYDETTFDIWLPSPNFPTGLVIYFHRYGFTSGDKSIVYETDKWDFPTEIRIN